MTGSTNVINVINEFPQSLFCGVILIPDVDNRIDDHTIPMLLRAEEAKIRGLSQIDFNQKIQSNVATTTINLLETIRGDVDIQRHNPLRDLCNLSALRFDLAINCWDCELLKPGDTLELKLQNEDHDASTATISELVAIHHPHQGTLRPLHQIEPYSKKGIICICGLDVQRSQAAILEISQSIIRLLTGQANYYLPIPTRLII